MHKQSSMALSERLKNFKIVRKILYAIIGVVSYPGFVWVNKLKISGTENIARLPRQNVLFVSNHQTYFADVITLLHIFSAVNGVRRTGPAFPFIY